MSEKLKRGDLARIAEITNYSENYVHRVLTAKDRKNERIQNAAKALVEQREQLKKAYQQ